MARFVVEGAGLSCQYGAKGYTMENLEERRIAAGEDGRQMCSEFDFISGEAGCFGGCRSPYYPDSNPAALRCSVSHSL